MIKSISYYNGSSYRLSIFFFFNLMDSKVVRHRYNGKLFQVTKLLPQTNDYFIICILICFLFKLNEKNSLIKQTINQKNPIHNYYSFRFRPEGGVLWL